MVHPTPLTLSRLWEEDGAMPTRVLSSFPGDSSVEQEHGLSSTRHREGSFLREKGLINLEETFKPRPVGLVM